MRAILPLTIILWLFTFWVAPVQANSAAEEMFFKGYSLNSEAEKLEQAGEMSAALNKYKEAQQTIATMAQSFPDWQRQVVSYRLSQIESAIARLQQVLSSSMGTPPATAPMAPAPVAPMTPNTPVYPQATAPNAPPVSGAIANPLETLNQMILAIQKQNEDLKRQVDVYENGYENMKQQVDNSRKEMASLNEEFKGLLENAEEMTRSVEKENEQLVTDLNATREEAKNVKALLEQKTKEFEEGQKNLLQLQSTNEQLIANMAEMNRQMEEVKKKGRPVAEVETLTKQNEALKKQLDEAMTQLEQAKTESQAKDQEIASLRTQIVEIQKEMTQLRQENTVYQGQVAELTIQLKELNAQLEKDGKVAPQDPESQKAVAANKKLKAILLRQLRAQQRTMQARELALEEMKKTENSSKSLVQSLEDMGTDEFKLSEEEEALFTEPELKEIFSLDQRVYATLQAPASPKATSAPVEPAPVKVSEEEEFLNGAADALAKSDYVTAARLYQEVLRVNPKNVLAIMNLAGIRLQERKYNEVDSWLKKGLAIEPDNDALHYRLGISLFQQGNLGEALGHFEQAAAKNKKNAKTHHYLGIISSRQGNFKRAEAEFSSALAIDPEYGDAYFNLAVLHATTNPPNWVAAKKNYDTAIAKGVKPDTGLEKLINDFNKG